MATVSFKIVPADGNWGIQQEAEVRGSYATKEAAFEAIAAAASNAIKEGHEISIQIPGSPHGESALGAD
jgi:hypothetical protein